jgi:ASC-1-like (ASCH) protein
MSKTHTIKINDWFVDDIISGRKRFEVRKNDRLYQAGDLIKFAPVNAEYQLQTFDDGIITSTDKLDDKVYRITFVESGYGLQNGFVAFGFEEVSE